MTGKLLTVSGIVSTYNWAHLIEGAILFQGDRVNISTFAKALAVSIVRAMEIYIESLVSELSGKESLHKYQIDR